MIHATRLLLLQPRSRPINSSSCTRKRGTVILPKSKNNAARSRAEHNTAQHLSHFLPSFIFIHFFGRYNTQRYFLTRQILNATVYHRNAQTRFCKIQFKALSNRLYLYVHLFITWHYFNQKISLPHYSIVRKRLIILLIQFKIWIKLMCKPNCYAKMLHIQHYRYF